jgi:hypothetical protein
MKVNHGDQVAVFPVYDDDVQNLALETCPILLALVCFCRNLFEISYILYVLICMLFCRVRVALCTLMKWSAIMVMRSFVGWRKGIFKILISYPPLWFLPYVL